MKHIIIIFFILLGILSCEAKGGGTQQDATYTYAANEDTSSTQDDTLSAVEVSLSQLQGTKWKEVSPIQEGDEKIWEFSDKEITRHYYYKHNNNQYEYKDPFYISNYFPTVYDQSLVGKKNTGKYLVMYIDTWDRMDWYTITSIDWNTGDMYLFRQLVADEVGGGDVTIHFKLISKNSGLSDDGTKAEESSNANQEAEPVEETPVYTPESIITSLKQITPEISKIIEELTNDDKIIIDDAQRTRYDSQNKQIYIGAGQTDEKVLHAIMHYLQDTQGELSYENKSVNNEFEASWLTFLTYFIRYGVFNEKTELGLTSNENREMEEYLIKSLSGNCAVNAYFYDFMDQYMTNDHLDKFSEEKRQSLNNDSSRDEYWHSKDYDYEYNWMQKLEMLGFKYRN